jgi:hypothetical protein
MKYFHEILTEKVPVFVSRSGLVLARVVDPVTAQQVVGIITGMGGKF